MPVPLQIDVDLIAVQALADPHSTHALDDFLLGGREKPTPAYHPKCPALPRRRPLTQLSHPRMTVDKPALGLASTTIPRVLRPPGAGG